MADDWGALIRSCLLILLVVGLLMSGNGRLVDAAVAESRHFSSTVPFSSLMREADGRGSLSSGLAVSGQGSRRSILEVVHNQNTQHLDRSEMLRRDDARVKWIQSKMIPAPRDEITKRDLMVSSATSIPTTSGINIGTGNYLVTVELGSPTKKLQLVMDTGSPLTWTQCQPCTTSCYNQTDPIFDPSASSTYSNITCSSSTCSRLFRRNPPSCANGDACGYSITYGDNSSSTGQLATDTLTLTSTVKLPNYIFGCGQDNEGFEGSDGLLGLSDDGIFSMVTQGASQFGKYFSYCLPPSTTSTGYLAFGNMTERSPNSTNLGYTPLFRVPVSPAFYGIRIIGISIGGVPLPVSSSRILRNSSSIIDSGTVITRLPPTVYTALRSAFRKNMVQYPRAPADPLFDTCYDFSKFSSITYPKVVISFSGGVNVDLDMSGIFFVNTPSQVCLAFAPHSPVSGLIIYGNVQQRTFEVAYDVTGQKLEFRANACS